MIESEWLASDDPAAMLKVFGPQIAWPFGDVTPGPPISARKLRLWVEACRAQTGLRDKPWGDYDLERPAGLRAACERWAKCDAPSAMPVNPLPARAALLRDICGSPFRPVTLPRDVRQCPDCDPDAPDRNCDDCGGSGRADFGPCPWLTPTVLSLARAAYEHRLPDGTLDPVRLAILADALEEAGGEQVCDHCNGTGARAAFDVRGRPSRHWKCRTCEGAGRVASPLVTHLRSPGPHVRGCFALDLLLGRQ